jgi:hypothetical protein
MGGACSTHRNDEKYAQYFGWETWKEETTRKTKRICKDNIRPHLREIEWEDMDWMHLA